MDFSKKTKKVAQQVIGDFKDEIVGERLKKSQPTPPKRSTLDVILGNFPKQEEQMNPIVEAMLQTRESEEKAKKKPSQDKLDIEMARQRQIRQQSEEEWEKSQNQIMSPPKQDEQKQLVVPSSVKKGPGAPKGKAQGIESFKRGKKN